MATAVRRRPGRHLASLRELRRHCGHAGKDRLYRGLLRDYGVDVAAFSDLVEHPRLIYAEQPGCWYYPEDLLRARLLEALLQTGEFAEGSGVLALSLDAFSDRGVKRWFTTFHLCEEVDEVHLLGSSYRRRHRHRTYAALDLSGGAFGRVSTLFGTAADMLEAARLGPETFADEFVDRFRRGIRPGIRPLLPAATDRAGLVRFAESLRRYRLGPALAQLAAPCTALSRGMGWTAFWNAVNSQFFGLPIAPLEVLYNRFLLTVSDPVQMARALRRDLREHCGQDDERDVSVAALVTPEEKYRMVFFDARSESFYFCDGSAERHALDWRELRRQAAAGRTGGPSGVLAYLMMAAAGIYLVSDAVDGTSPFESAARTIHEQRIGLRFPSLAPLSRSPAARGGFLQVHTEAFDRCVARTLDRFLA